MVFGWGKKKSQESKTSIKEEMEIKLSDVNSKVEEIQNIRKKTVIAESKAFRKKMREKIDEISKIIKELEHDDLNVEDIDKHLEILVVRGKKQVIDSIKREDSEKLPDIKTIEDVFEITELVTHKLKRMGDALGRQSRVIHIFAKKYAAKLKSNLAVLNEDRNDLQELVNNYKKLNDDTAEISKKIAKYNEVKNNLEADYKTIKDAKKSIEEFEKKIESTQKSISELKASEQYSKYIETQKNRTDITKDNSRKN